MHLIFQLELEVNKGVVYKQAIQIDAKKLLFFLISQRGKDMFKILNIRVRVRVRKKKQAIQIDAKKLLFFLINQRGKDMFEILNN